MATSQTKHEVKLLKDAGWYEVEQDGAGHRQFAHPDMGRQIVTMAFSPSDSNGPRQSVREAYRLLGRPDPWENKMRPAEERKGDNEIRRRRAKAQRERDATIREAWQAKAALQRSIEREHNANRRDAMRAEDNHRYYERLMTSIPGR